MGDTAPVRAWAETVRIPTYGLGPPDRNPMFLDKRVYQGSSGTVYPHPVIDRVLDTREDKEYTAVFLENRYVKVMVLPALGGRVQMALDKTNNYHFIYYNRVIKPALVGLAGPWISGGLEFNWPQHHRPSTFSPVDWTIEEHADGGRTVWCSEIEAMFRTRGLHGIHVSPDRAGFEVRVRLHNRTSEPQTFLWWANPAVHVHDDYQSVFPPDVHAVLDHGKRAVCSFPIATGTYYKVDYSPGTDISRHSTIPVPTSYMAYHSDFDFLGCYDHRAKAGMLHVADHHLVPGKKQWTWGNGDFGRAWDRHLTDEDGPYIELMCGAFTDNQPDFSWIMPGEEKRFTQLFYPYKLIGPPKNASRDAALNLEVAGRKATVGAYVTSPRRVRVVLRRGNQTLFDRTASLSPEKALVETVDLPRAFRPAELRLEMLAGGEVLLACQPSDAPPPPVPEPASPARPPRDIASSEELYLNGLHLEQYRHATFAPEPYYEEALRRDLGDSRCNNALGRLLYRRGQFAEAEPYFRRAIERLTLRNPNPYDGEPSYNLGLLLVMQGRFDEAYHAFYKAVWNDAWQPAGYFELARIAARRGEFDRALDHLGECLAKNGLHHMARHLRIALLRRSGRHDQAHREIAVALALDPLAYGALHEQDLLSGAARLDELCRGSGPTLVEIGLNYLHAGLFDEARALFARGGTDPLAGYLVAWAHEQQGQSAKAKAALVEAAKGSPDFFFPNRLECVPVLEWALRVNPKDARAAYGLGNFWYAHRRPDEAIAAWRQCRTAAPDFPTVYRNLGLASFNRRREPGAALQLYEKAFSLDPSDARVLFELDQLTRKMGRPPAERLARLEQYPKLVALRDDLAIEKATALNSLGRHAEALELLQGRRFHPWEGGEGKVVGQYVAGLVGLAVEALQAGQPDEALAFLEQARHYPQNLGEGKLPGTQENSIFYWMGRAHATRGGPGDKGAAREAFQKAARGPTEPTSALYYNDQPPDMIFYQGLARRELGQDKAAREIFRSLVAYGRDHLHDEAAIDYFAVSLPDFLVFEDDLARRHQAHCRYMAALGWLGLGKAKEAKQEFDALKRLDPNHQGGLLHRRLFNLFLGK